MLETGQDGVKPDRNIGVHRARLICNAKHPLLRKIEQAAVGEGAAKVNRRARSIIVI